MRQILTPRPKIKSATKRKLNEGALPPRFALPQNTLGQKKQEDGTFLLAVNIPEREAEPRICRYFLRPT
jgi:hypothetical protein